MGLMDLYNEVFEGENQEIEKIAEVEQEFEAMEKLAEEYVTAGRFMAQGYADEMEKLAGKLQDAGSWIAKKGKDAYDAAKKAGSAANPIQKGRYGKALEDVKKGFGKGPKNLLSAGHAKVSLGERAKHVGKAAIRMSPELAVGGAVTAYGAKKAFGKKDKE